ncbi:MAG: hypothetical protein M3N54_12560, partial [Acidobacteriota bacterium]|nr:hypothetical protein [Acidobacteriota bacterium]
PGLVQMDCTIGQPDIEATEKLYPLVQRGIRGGWFAPNRNSTMCSRRYCSFWRACTAEFGGTVND